MMKQVMKRAWELAKEGAKKFGGKVREYFASSLSIAWKEQKQMNVIELVSTLDNGSKVVAVEVNCKRCGGDGLFTHLAHVHGGRCFACNGTGKEIIQEVVSANTMIKIVASSKPKQFKSVQVDYTEFTKKRNEEIKANRNEMIAKIKEADKRNAESVRKNEDYFDITSLLD